MTKRIKKILSYLILLSTCFYMAQLSSSMTRAADDQGGAKTIPAFAITLNNLFDIPNPATGGASVAYINDPTKNRGVPYDEISLKGNGVFTSIWSKENNLLDFSKDFEGRAYVNFGTQASDGLAFVMHNDSQKTRALSKANSQQTDGQSLGVYGKGNYTFLSTPNETAIQNSVAIEFDTYPNGDGFDQEVAAISKKTHMAYVFPSNPKTYTRLTGGNRNRYKMQHNGTTFLDASTLGTSEIRDNRWYEFRYSFNKQAQSFTYYLSNPTNGIHTQPVTIPFAELSAELKLAENNNKAYWGFTAANGINNGEVKFAFAKAPVSFDGTVKSDVLNQQNQSVVVNEDATSPSDNKVVISGENAKITSTFSTNTSQTKTTFKKFVTALNFDYFDTKQITQVILKKGQTVIPATVQVSPDELDQEGNTVNKQTITISPRTTVTLNPGETITVEYMAKTKAKLLNSQGNESIGLQKTVFKSVAIVRGQDQLTDTSFQADPAYFFIDFTQSKTQLSWEKGSLAVKTKTQTIKDSDFDAQNQLSVPFFWKDSDYEDNLVFRLKDATGKEIAPALTGIQTTGSKEYQSLSFKLNQNMIPYGESNYRITVERKNSAVEDTLDLTLSRRKEFAVTYATKRAAQTEAKANDLLKLDRIILGENLSGAAQKMVLTVPKTVILKTKGTLPSNWQELTSTTNQYAWKINQEKDLSRIQQFLMELVFEIQSSDTTTAQQISLAFYPDATNEESKTEVKVDIPQRVYLTYKDTNGAVIKEKTSYTPNTFYFIEDTFLDKASEISNYTFKTFDPTKDLPIKVSNVTQNFTLVYEKIMTQVTVNYLDSKDKEPVFKQALQDESVKESDQTTFKIGTNLKEQLLSFLDAQGLKNGEFIGYEKMNFNQDQLPYKILIEGAEKEVAGETIERVPTANFSINLYYMPQTRFITVPEKVFYGNVNIQDLLFTSYNFFPENPTQSGKPNRQEIQLLDTNRVEDWHLEGNMSKMIQRTKDALPLYGGLFFQFDGSSPNELNIAAKTLLTDKQKVLTTIPLSKAQQNEKISGLSLGIDDVEAQAKSPGEYQGQVEWSLSNVPGNTSQSK